jgi:hypothetical protein
MQAHDPVNLRLMKRIPGNDREVSGFDLELEAKVVGARFWSAYSVQLKS